MRKAQASLRQGIINLVDELHWQAIRWLTSNYRVILLPTFETQDMTRRAGRKIRSKTARMMLSFRHYEFKRRLKWKAWQRGVLVLEVNEAYTSRTRSWDGAVKANLGGSKVIRDESGFGMDRDVNGARGIFLRALGDSPSCVAWSRRLQRSQRTPHCRTLVSVYLSEYMRVALAVLMTVLLLATLACTGGDLAPSPATTPEPEVVETPDLSGTVEAAVAATFSAEAGIEATVTARVDAIKAVQPTIAPMPAPTATLQPTSVPTAMLLPTASPPPRATPEPGDDLYIIPEPSDDPYITLTGEEKIRLISGFFDCLHTNDYYKELLLMRLDQEGEMSQEDVRVFVDALLDNRDFFVLVMRETIFGDPISAEDFMFLNQTLESCFSEEGEISPAPSITTTVYLGG